MRKTILIFTIISLTFCAKGQEDFVFPKSSDIGLNITNVLSAFLGNNGSEINVNSYPFIAKFNWGRNAIRVGVGFKFDNSDDRLILSEQFIFNNFQLNSRVGFERKKYLGNRFGFFYGLDFISVIRNEESVVSNNIDVTTLISDQLGFGGGPVYGFEYYLNNLMYLGAEGHFYGLYSLTRSSTEFEFNPDINTMRETRAFDARLTAPVSLYLMVRF